MTARILDCTPTQYFRDPCRVPSLSSSIAKLLIDQSPAHAYAAHPRLGGNRVRKSTKEMDAGTILHALVLGAGLERVVVLPFDNFLKKAAQVERDNAYNEGKTPVCQPAYQRLVRTAEKVKDELFGLGIELSGRSEVVIEWQEPVDGTDETVTCRCQVDHLILDQMLALDLKTGDDANPRTFAGKVHEMAYDIQYAAYSSALRHLRPDLAGREDFVFIACEVDEPFCVTPMRLTGTYRELGQRRWQRAVRMWFDCMKSGHWPGYAVTTDPIAIDPPAWALAREAI